MKFLISVIDNHSNSGTASEMSAINAFNDSLRANNQFIFAWGLEDPSTAFVIDNREGANINTGKPLYSEDEFVSGFWLIEAKDQLQAKELAFAASKACNRKVELRKLHGN